MILSNQGIHEGLIEAGNRLAELPESEGGWAEYFSETDEADLRIKDPMLRAHTALMLENSKRWMAGKSRMRPDASGRMVIDEATKSATVGGWADYIFPIVRAAFPTNPVNDLVSVQPTTRKTATIVYWNWIVGKTKGNWTKGKRLFDANVGKPDSGYNFSNEVIEGEPIAALGSAGVTVAGTLAYNDGGGVRPGTVSITLVLTTGGATIYSDNGQGAFVAVMGTGTISASSIDYVTGAWSITVATNTFTTAATNTATYRWDSEGSASLPEVDVQITTSSAETERRALRMNYSLEAMQDLMAEFGVSLEPNLIAGASEHINFEIARQIISELWAVAPEADTFESSIIPSGISQAEHFRDIMFNVGTVSNNIWRRTQKGRGNWIVIDELMSNLIESLPNTLFQAAPTPSNVQGIHYCGMLGGKYRVYKDIHLDDEAGAQGLGNMLMGFKGGNFWEAGFVWAPYQLMYTTPSLQTADFMTQKGIATRYATKMVNPDMYVRLGLV